MVLSDDIKRYWSGRVLYSWGGYEEMRKLRYETYQRYMFGVFEFDKFRGKDVLEVGCGGGIDAIEFAVNGARVTATDLTEASVLRTSELAELVGVDVSTRVASACDLPFEDECFDHVHCLGVLHHIPRVDLAVSEIHRVLRRGGTVYAMLYNRDSILYYVSILFIHGVLEEGLKYMSEEDLLSRFSEAKEGCPYTRVY